MKWTALLLTLVISVGTRGQELYVSTEPASNLPAGSMNLRVSGLFMAAQPWHDQFMQRWTPAVSMGISKRLMLRTELSFANMHTNNFAWESIGIYGKYRFLSKDDVHRHFRMAAFFEASSTRAPFHNDELNFEGDKSGLRGGLIATQLWHRFALSGSVSHAQVLDDSRKSSNIIYVPSRIYQGMGYSLSGGYLLLPADYKDYSQTNLNLYFELLAQQSLDRKAYFVDLAPAVQLIFSSTTKVNLAYRFQLGGTMQRMAPQSWQFTVERSFLNALRSRKS